MDWATFLPSVCKRLIYNVSAVISETTVELVYNYNTAIATIVDKYAPIIMRIVTGSSKDTVAHGLVVLCEAKPPLRRATMAKYATHCPPTDLYDAFISYLTNLQCMCIYILKLKYLLFILLLNNNSL